MKIAINNLFTVSSLALASIASTTAIAADDSAHKFMTAAPVVVTATRFAASIDTAPVNVTTITAEDIARSNASTLSDVLKAQAGISVSNLFGISGSKAKVDMGGFGGNSGQNTLVLLNGRRLNDVDLQGANLAAIPLDSIAQVEIVYGSGTVLYGDNAVGGVINIVTKNGFDGEQGTLKLQTGSFQTQRLSGDLRTLANDTALSFAFDGLKSNGYRDNGAFDSFSLMTEVSRERDGKNYGARINASREKLQLPGALDEATFKSNPSASANPLEQAKERRFAIEGYFAGKNLAAELTLSKKHQEAFVFGDVVADLSTLSFTPRTKRQYGNHNLVAGADLYHSRLETNAVWDNSPFAPPAFIINDSEITRDSYALYITDTINFGDSTSLNFGARHQQVKLDIENDGTLSGQVSDDSGDKLNAADITLSHKHNYGGRNYVRLARSFRSPVLDEMWSYYDGSIGLLKPQTANHVEIGTRQTFGNGMQLSANLFRMNINDEIAYDGSANVNLDKTRHDGLNIDLNTTITSQLSINAGYAYRKASFRAGDNDDNIVPQVPKHKLTMSGNYQLDDKRQLGLNVAHNGKRYFGNDFANVGKQMRSYTQVDASYIQQFSHWKARVLVQNLTNVNVADAGYYAWWLTPPYTYYPLPERALYITFEGEL
ncbi:MAG: TonB-dependent receptor [Gammaproteobacteria bacterium]|nr:TonB-dependent receptor [Gammaproteobacteria bacterium]